MILSDKTIKQRLQSGQIKIEPFDPQKLQPASYDVALGSEFMVFDRHKTRLIDPRENITPIMGKVNITEENPFILHPGEFALAATEEIIGVDANHLVVLNGKSSLGRMGLLIHATAGFIDPGNELRITLELFNVATAPIILYPGMKIAQVVFEELSETCQRPYGHPELNSKYYKDLNVKGSQMHQNFSQISGIDQTTQTQTKTIPKGKFIVIDGTDGSGKGTQTKLLVQKLEQQGHQVKMADFPQYGQKSSALVEEYLNGNFGTAENVGPYRASIFYACDRFAAADKIKHWLEQGYIVIANRYVSSNMGHQAGKIKDPAEREQFLEWLDNLEYDIFQIPRPDLNILLYVPPEIGQQLVDKKHTEERQYLENQQRDIHEADLQHLRDAAQAYKEVASKYNWTVIDCAPNNQLKSIEEIHNILWQEIHNKF